MKRREANFGLALVVIFAALAWGCDDDPETVHIEEAPGCEPLVSAICAFPFPSMYYLEEDSGTPTGHRVAVTEEALPGNFLNTDVFLEHFNAADGFSRATPWLTIFPEKALDTSTLPSLDDLAASASSQSAIQVIDRETGYRYPVWAEVDPRTDVAEEQTLIIRPMEGLALGQRVVVVITDALRNEDGSTPVTPPAFAALRDKLATDSENIEGRREGFEELFDFLAQQELPRERLLLAWEAVTFSDDFALDQLQPLVEAATDQVAATPPTYEISECFTHDEEDVTAHGCIRPSEDETPLTPLTWRRIFVEAQLPNYVADDGYIHTDAAGVPELQGTRAVQVVINLPASLRDASAGSAPVVVFGHGLLREPYRYLASDVDYEGQMALADQMGAIFVGTHWSGLSSDDLVEATGLLNDASAAFLIAATLRQGIVNQILLTPLMTEVLAADELLQATDGSGSIVAGEHLFYTGISLGGIFGTTLMTFSPYVATGVLHVPGAGFVHMMAHSVDFALFQVLLDGPLSDRREQQMFFALAQRMFDVGDPINYLEHLTEDPLTPLGPKNCLWQCAIGDTQAMWYGCDMLVRTGGFPVVAPTVAEVFGTTTIDAPTAPDTSGMTQFDPGLGLPSLDGDGGATGAHTAIRRNPEVHLQTIDYFDLENPGQIVNHCDGPCFIDPVPEPEDE